ncbi:MAG TPA: GNAT family N-acetyltransferase [Azonexus sp.]|nr:GNAT family N-acetyltransferase [Azonexus sp.]
MIDARHYAETESLRNGLNICVRASRPDDSERIVDAFRLLDPESVYLRFFGPKKEISPAELQRICEPDFENRVILLCTIMQDGREIVIASGTYVRVGEDAAEVAFIVEEDFHRLGIAGRLIKHLGRIALAAGIKTFLAEVLPHNTAMLGVFKRCGWPMTSEVSDGTVHLTLELKS